MATLNSVITTALNSAYAGSEALIASFIQVAETQLQAYSKELPLLPDYSVTNVRASIANKRIELWSKALADINKAQAPIVAEKLSTALLGYFNTHNISSLIALSLTAPNGPVTGDQMGTIEYD